MWCVFQTKSHLKGRFSHDVLSQGDIRGSAGFERDWMEPKVFQHVKDGLEPEMLHSALSLVTNGKT